MMANRTLFGKVMLLFLVLLGISMVVLPYFSRAYIKPLTYKPLTPFTIEIASARFLYLTQTENCIPTYLKSPEVIGDSDACQCDVIILSYKQKCADTSLRHVQYIFNSSKSTTWTVGRNLLYEAAKERKEKYMYYIFMDDDLELKSMIKNSAHNPWRMYEKSLKTFQPAVVIIPLDNEYRGFSTENLSKGVNCELTVYVQIYHMDAILNAFHYQVMDHILPYTPKYDSVSWWYSQLFTMIRCNILFNGEVVIDPRLRIRNPKHRSYPRTLLTHDIYHNIVVDIRPEIPDKYQNSTKPILQQWSTDHNSKWKLGRQTCKRDLSVHPYRPYENLA